MGIHARLLADLKLVNELKRSKGRDDVPAEEVEKLVALVNHVADTAGPLLERIPATFKQYTEHNIQHCRNLVDLMGRFIPRETLKQLNALELAVLILSALLHDFGMFVSEEEKQHALGSPEFESFLSGHHDRATALEEARTKGDHRRAEVIQDALLAEYFRHMHPERARVKVRENLAGQLVYRNVDISPHVLDVCESHAWGVRESNDPQHPEKSVGALSTNKAIYGVPLNLQYIACCLRLADIMDFDRSRTPLVVFQNISFTEEKSWQEWNKHLAVRGWIIDEREVMFGVECKQPAFYVAVMEFLDWVDYELGECRRLVAKEAPHDIAARYKLHLPPVVDRTQVEMEDKTYLAGAFRFQLEYDRIMQLLMDKSLYPDPSLFLRELLQNSLDACRNREARAREHDAEALYEPRIVVWDYSDDPSDPRIIFQDNGVGMSRKIVENYFMRVGRSYYRSPEFDAERARLKKKHIDLEATSQFGIGILSCFMVTDRFEVETYKVGNNPLHITIEGPTKYFTIKLLPEPPRTDFQPPPATDLQDRPPHRPGTRITVHLRPDDPRPKVYDTLNTFAVNVEYDIHVHQSHDPHQHTIPRGRWESEQPWMNTLRFGAGLPYGVDTTTVLENLTDVLAPSVIPLTGNDISPHLRGSAWLWLIQDKGRVYPQQGYLRMNNYGLAVHGLPVCVEKARELIWQRGGKPDLIIKTLQSNLSEGNERVLSSDEYVAIVQVVGEDLVNEVSELIDEWNKLSTEERAIFQQAIELRLENITQWYTCVGKAKELQFGSHRLLSQPIGFADRLLLLENYPVAVSLHGIYLPAGLLEWNPMTGISNKLNILTVPGGVQLDVRGPLTPIPAASRLFVDSQEADKVLVPFNRVVMRHALELAASNPDASGWDDWFDRLLRSISYASFASIVEELGLLQTRLRYLVKIEGQEAYLSRQEVIDKLGRWASVSGMKYDENNAVLERRDGLRLNTGTTLLLSSKTRRQREDGFWEVDMESDFPVQREALSELLKQLRLMQSIKAK